MSNSWFSFHHEPCRSPARSLTLLLDFLGCIFNVPTLPQTHTPPLRLAFTPIFTSQKIQPSLGIKYHLWDSAPLISTFSPFLIGLLVAPHYLLLGVSKYDQLNRLQMNSGCQPAWILLGPLLCSLPSLSMMTSMGFRQKWWDFYLTPLPVAASV